MKRIGIISLYYNNVNYGGALQAYALVKHLQKQGYEAEQIQVQRIYLKQKRTIRDYFNLTLIRAKLKYVLYTHIQSKKQLEFDDLWKKRCEAVAAFRNEIPHSLKVYTDDSIANCVSQYDCFVVGSDQVWGPEVSSSPYLLNFVPDSKRKFSYAASMGATKISSDQRALYRQALAKYNGISVRESDVIKMLEPIDGKQILQVLDPTLLLSKEDWEAITPPRMIEESYLLCYYLGDDFKTRETATTFAHRHNLKIVTFPHCPCEYHKSDENFGDIKIWDAGPEDFLSLIKHAEAVFTDSFHGCVFSLLFQKQFFAFNRKGSERMIGRMRSLVTLFDVQGRFFEKETVYLPTFLDSVPEIDYSVKRTKFLQMKEQSLIFLRDQLGEE